MQTAVQNSQAIRLWSVKMFLDNVNLGLLEDAQLEVVYNVIDLRAHNWKLPPRKKVESVKATASIWELFFDNLSKIDNHGVFEDIAAAPVNITWEALGTWWIVWSPIKLANKNGAYSEVSSVIINSDGSPLISGTDYSIYLSDGSNGEKWYTYIVPKTAQTWVLVASYSYTPNAKKKATWSDVTKLIALYELRMVNTDENGKNLTITIPKGYASGNMTWGFVADDAVDEVMKMPFEFMAFPDENNKILVIEDEQSV